MPYQTCYWITARITEVSEKLKGWVKSAVRKKVVITFFVTFGAQVRVAGKLQLFFCKIPWKFSHYENVIWFTAAFLNA